MKISHLRALHATAVCRSFSEAALMLDCTQSSVSYAVSEVEKFIGFRVFLRSCSGCEATADGREAISRIERILEILSELEALHREPAGIVRLGCIRSVTHWLSHSLFLTCWSYYPKIRLEIIDDCDDEITLRRHLHEGTVDLVIARRCEDGGFINHLIFDDCHDMLILPSEMKISSLSEEVWQRLAGMRYLEHHGARTHSQLASFQVAFRSTDIGTILSLVRKGVGFSVLPQTALPAPGTDPSFLALEFAEAEQLVVAGRPRSLMSRAACAVLDLLYKLAPISSFATLRNEDSSAMSQK